MPEKKNQYTVIPVWDKTQNKILTELPYKTTDSRKAAFMADSAFEIGAEEVVIRIEKVEA